MVLTYNRKKAELRLYFTSKFAVEVDHQTGKGRINADEKE